MVGLPERQSTGPRGDANPLGGFGAHDSQNLSANVGLLAQSRGASINGPQRTVPDPSFRIASHSLGPKGLVAANGLFQDAIVLHRRVAEQQSLVDPERLFLERVVDGSGSH